MIVDELPAIYRTFVTLIVLPDNTKFKMGESDL